MRVKESVYLVKIPFRIPAGVRRSLKGTELEHREVVRGGRFIDRSVNSFMAVDRGICP